MYVSREEENSYILCKASVIFLNAPCPKLQFLIHDAFVSHTRDHTGHIFKNPHGEGCKVDVDFWLKKNNGEFQFSSTDDKTDLSPILETMKFGDDNTFPGTSAAFDELKGVKLRNIGSTTHDYILKLLKTHVTDGKDGSSSGTDMYQYTFSHREHFERKKKEQPKPATPPAVTKDGKPVPPPAAEAPKAPEKPKTHFIRFKYNWSPLSIDYKVKYHTLYQVLTNSMAYCGGIFTTASVLYRAYIGGAAIVKDTISKKL